MTLRVFNTPERRALARAAEPRIVRGAHLVRLHAKFKHALGEHRKKMIFFGYAQMEMTVFAVLVFQFSVGLNTWLNLSICLLAFFRLAFFFVISDLLRSHYCGCLRSSWKLPSKYF